MFFKQPVSGIVGSIHSLFSVPVALFLDISLHPASFAHAVRNPIPGHSTPVPNQVSHKTMQEHRGPFENMTLMVEYTHSGFSHTYG